MKRATNTNGIRSLYARWERMEDARRDLSEDLKELFKEAKSDGLNAKALRTAFAERYAADHDDAAKIAKREENDNDVELYMAALASHACEEVEIDVKTPDNLPVKTVPAAPFLTNDGDIIDMSTGEIMWPASEVRIEELVAVAGDTSKPAESLANEISAPIEHPTPGSSPDGASDQTGGEVLPDAPPVAQFEPAAFLKKDSTAPKPELNPRCEKPATCKFSHHPQKITCGTCSTAWAIAQRKKAVPA